MYFLRDVETMYIYIFEINFDNVLNISRRSLVGRVLTY